MQKAEEKPSNGVAFTGLNGTYNGESVDVSSISNMPENLTETSINAFINGNKSINRSIKETLGKGFSNLASVGLSRFNFRSK